jgi:hypothetical protein
MPDQVRHDEIVAFDPEPNLKEKVLRFGSFLFNIIFYPD